MGRGWNRVYAAHVCIGLFLYILHLDKGAPPPPRKGPMTGAIPWPSSGGNGENHQLAATGDAPLKKTASILSEHCIGFCKCLFYTLKLNLCKLRWYRQDIEEGPCERFCPVVFPCRFANLRNNGAGQFTLWFLRNFSSILGQIITVFPKSFKISIHKKC